MKNVTLKEFVKRHPNHPAIQFTSMDYIVSILAFVGHQGEHGATYWEWWKWFSESFNQGRTDTAAMEYRGTCTARWAEAKLDSIRILIPKIDPATGKPAKRSQAESKPGAKSRRGGVVYVLRDGACITDWIKGDKHKGNEPRDDEKAVIQFYRSLKRSYPSANQRKAEKLLLKFTMSVARIITRPKKENHSVQPQDHALG